MIFLTVVGLPSAMFYGHYFLSYVFVILTNFVVRAHESAATPGFSIIDSLKMNLFQHFEGTFFPKKTSKKSDQRF